MTRTLCELHRSKRKMSIKNLYEFNSLWCQRSCTTEIERCFWCFTVSFLFLKKNKCTLFSYVLFTFGYLICLDGQRRLQYVSMPLSNYQIIQEWTWSSVVIILTKENRWTRRKTYPSGTSTTTNATQSVPPWWEAGDWPLWTAKPITIVNNPRSRFLH